MPAIRLGVIGYGGRAQHMVRLMCAGDTPARLAAIADPNHEAIRQTLGETGGTRFYETADAMLDAEPLDGVVIGTRCSRHTPMALKALARGLPLFLEKPISTNYADLAALRAAGDGARVVVSFPLRVSSLVTLARKILASGELGEIEHVQAWNNVTYGAVYFQSWYRDENETGGLFLQKATHDFDYLNFLLGDNQPRVISAMTSKRIFHGTHPAGLHCQECPERTVCHESPYHPSRPNPLPLDQPAPDLCAFAVDTGNEDSGSALIQYDSGMHVAYSQNFFVRRDAGRRGARLMGYHGTLEFDWYSETLKVYRHHAPSVETHGLDESDGHGGGDTVLASNFLQMIRGEAASVAPLDAGLLSALMCLKARESAATHTFQEITFPADPVAAP